MKINGRNIFHLIMIIFGIISIIIFFGYGIYFIANDHLFGDKMSIGIGYIGTGIGIIGLIDNLLTQKDSEKTNTLLNTILNNLKDNKNNKGTSHTKRQDKKKVFLSQKEIKSLKETTSRIKQQN